MSFSQESDKWSESIRQFVYDRNPRELSDRILGTCLRPGLAAIGITDKSVDVDASLGFGFGGEMTRYTYWQGLQRLLGEPPLSFPQAKEIVTCYSEFSNLISPREGLVIALLGSITCAYEKGFNAAFGEIS